MTTNLFPTSTAQGIGARAHQRRLRKGDPRQNPITFGEALRMHAAYRAGLSMAGVGAEFGRSASGVQKAFANWNLKTRGPGAPRKPEPEPEATPVPPFVAIRWCAQCERRVQPNEAAACQSRWCRAKVAA